MIITELLGHPLVVEGDDVELQYAIDDIILRARKGNITEINLRDLAGELSKAVGIYIDPDNEEFKQKLMDVLQQNDWVAEVQPTGKIVIKSPDEFQPAFGGGEPGDEIEQARDDQHAKAQKIASKNIKNKGGENIL